MAVVQFRQDVIQAARRYHEASGNIVHRQKSFLKHVGTLPHSEKETLPKWGRQGRDLGGAARDASAARNLSIVLRWASYSGLPVAISVS